MYKVHNKTERLIGINLAGRDVANRPIVKKRIKFPPGMSKFTKAEYDAFRDHWWFKTLQDSGELVVKFKDGESEEITRETQAFIEEQQQKYKNSSDEELQELEDSEDELRGVPDAVQQAIADAEEKAAAEDEEKAAKKKATKKKTPAKPRARKTTKK